MKTHLIIGDSHAHPDHHNKRATWLGELINDVKPDVVVHIGDSADMPSLSSYDRGKKSFQGRTYKADIDAHLDFQYRLWDQVASRKRRMPERHFFEGNHEQRITRAIDLQPELEGTVDFADLDLGRWYDSVTRYSANTPGVRVIDGIAYAHYFVTGIAGKALSGLHPADSLIQKKHTSATCGHSHLADWSTQIDLKGNRLHGCVVGCYQDYNNDWAGNIAEFWWRGIVVKRNVDGHGNFDPQFISLDAIKKEYGHLT